MRLPHVPPELVGDLSDVVEQLERAAEQRETPWEPIEQLCQALPDAIRNAPCFLDRLTGLWRYEFGEPIEGEDGRIMVGTQMFTPIGTLLECLVVVSQRLTPDQASIFMRRLADSGRHQDVVAEMFPLRDIPLSVPARFEVPGVGGTTVDWEIRPGGGPVTLLDVKNRILDLVQQLGSMPRDAVEVPAPDHDHNAMARGVQHKFAPADSAQRLQGVWVTTVLAQRADLLMQAFELLDADRVHFLVLNNNHREGLVFTRRNVVGDWVYDLFGLAERPDLVFHPEDGGKA